MARTTKEAKGKATQKHYKKVEGSLFFKGKQINAGDTFWADPKDISGAFMDTIIELEAKKKK